MRPSLNSFFLTHMQILLATIVRFVNERWLQTSAALTYTSLFAIVPALTLLISMVSILPQFESGMLTLQQFLFDHFVPSSSEAIQSYLLTFAAEARKLTLFGALMLIVTVLLLMANIEDALNKIWRVKKGRNWTSKLLLYWAAISIGPIFLAVGLALVGGAASSDLGQGIQAYLPTWTRSAILPLIVDVALFAGMYSLVPNCRVRLKHAFLGAVVAALLFEALKKLFAFGLFSPNYSALYGTFAIVPLFLVWIYLSWIVVLFGALFAHGLSNGPLGDKHAKQYDRLVMALYVMSWLWRRKAAGTGFNEQQWYQLKSKATVPYRIEWRETCEALIQGQLIIRDNQGHLRIGRDYKHVAVLDLLVIIYPEWNWLDINVTDPTERWLCDLEKSCNNLKHNLSTPLTEWLDDY